VVAAPVEAVFVAPAADDAVPVKINKLFAEYDTDGNGMISEEELTSSLKKAFPDMKPWAAEQIPEQFAKYATGEPKGLDKPAFTKVYAAFLFRYFDANGDGALQASECEAALNFLSGGTLAVAVPQGCASDEAVVSKLDFWLMFKAMMGLSPPIKSDLETAADALIAAGFRVTEEEVAWLKQRVPVGAA